MPESAILEPTSAATTDQVTMQQEPDAEMRSSEKVSATTVIPAHMGDDHVDMHRRAEYWKGILQEHPMSPEFIEAHEDLALLIPEDIDNQAKTLAIMEKQIEQGAEDARRFLDDSSRFDNPQDRSLKELFEALYQVDQHGIIIDDGPKFEVLIQNDSMTVGELVARYRHYYQKLTKKFLNGSHKRATILNSVRTGDASRSLLPESARPETDSRAKYSIQQQ